MTSRSTAIESTNAAAAPVTGDHNVDRQEATARQAFQARIRKVRVLFVVDQLSVLGGGERALIQMVRGLSNRFEPSVVTFRGNVHPEAVSLLDVPIAVIPIRRTYSFSGLIGAVRLGRLIRSKNVDVVHTFFETSDLYGGIVAKLSGVRALISSRRDMGLLRSAKHKFAYRLVGRMCKRVITVSEAVRSHVLAADALPAQRVSTLYTGVRTAPPVQKDALVELRTRIGIPAEARVVLTVANILPWKGHHEFLEAAAVVHEQYRDVHFVVAGAFNDTGLHTALVAKRAALGLEACFHFAGEVRPVTPLYQVASVFCLLSKTEGLPNVVLEAMAAGTPVVATSVGGTGELVAHGKTGFLVEPESPRDAAARIMEMLKSPHRAQQMAEAARNRIQSKFSMEKMIQSLEGIYDACLAE